MPKSSRFAPFMHCGETVNSQRIDLLVSLLPLLLIASLISGKRVLILAALCTFTAVTAETVGNLILKKKFVIEPESAICGLMIPMLCPVTVPIYLPITATAFSVAFIRVILKRYFPTLFMTPPIAWLFMMSVAPDVMTTYPSVAENTTIPIFSDITKENFVVFPSLSQQLSIGQKPYYTLFDLFFGRVPGGLGTTCVAIIAVIMLFIFYRRAAAWQVTLSMVATVAVFAVFVDRTNSGFLYSVLFEISAASFLFAATFIANDLSSCPMIPISRTLYGIALGVSVMVMRYLGLGEYSVLVPIIVMNFLSPRFDDLVLFIKNKRRKLKQA